MDSVGPVLFSALERRRGCSHKLQRRAYSSHGSGTVQNCSFKENAKGRCSPRPIGEGRACDAGGLLRSGRHAPRSTIILAERYSEGNLCTRISPLYPTKPGS